MQLDSSQLGLASLLLFVGLPGLTTWFDIVDYLLVQSRLQTLLVIAVIADILVALVFESLLILIRSK